MWEGEVLSSLHQLNRLACDRGCLRKQIQRTGTNLHAFLANKISNRFMAAAKGTGIMLSERPPPLGIAHFTGLEVSPLELASLAARAGFAFVGLRLHPAFPEAPSDEIPQRSQAMREMWRRLSEEGVKVHDIEFVTVDEGFQTESVGSTLESASELGAKRLSVCGDDPDRSRQVASFAALCDAAGVPTRLIRIAQLCDAPVERPTTNDAIIQKAWSGRLPPGMGALPLCELLRALPDDTALSVEVPMGHPGPPDLRAARIFSATRKVLEDCRRLERQA